MVILQHAQKVSIFAFIQWHLLTISQLREGVRFAIASRYKMSVREIIPSLINMAKTGKPQPPAEPVPPQPMPPKA